MSHADALDRLEIACQVAVARDLEHVGAEALYVLDAVEVGLPESCLGAAEHALCYTLQDRLRGGWRGPGPAFIVRADCLPSPAELGAVAAHELGHCLADRMLSPVRPSDLPRASAVLLESFREFEPPLVNFDDMHHRAEFARAAVHAAFRLVTLADHPAGIYGLWPRSQCRVACWDAFRALEAEMRDRLAEPIAEILATPAPIEFSNLFTAARSEAA